MKFIHTADLHLGAVSQRLSSEKKRLCKQEQIAYFSDMFEYAKNCGAEFILIAGDLFHSKTMSAKLVNIFFAQVKEFEKPVIYVRGNHDEETSFVPPSNFIICEDLTELDFGDVKVYAQSGNAVKLSVLDGKYKNIVMLHGDIFSSGNDYIDLNLLKNKNIDYLALGHLHTFQEQDFGRGKLCYSGCLFGNGFDECGQKGFLCVDCTDKIIAKFVPSKSRSYQIVNVDITGLMKFQEIVDAIKCATDKFSRKEFLRVVLTGYFDESAEKYLSLIEEEFSDQFYFEIKDESKLKIDLEKYKGEKLSFKAELLNLLEKEDSLSENEKSKIGQIAIEALRGDVLSL